MKVKSPLTGHDSVTLLQAFSTQKIISDWQSFFNINVTAELEPHQHFYLYQCNITGLRFFHPLDIFGSSQLYEKLMKFEWYYMSNKWEYKIALQDFRSNNKALEVGCGQGHFLSQAIESGIQIKGIDSNERAVLDAKKNGLDVHQLSVADLLADEKFQYDCLCSFQVLEHLPDPLPFLRSCLELLKPGGKLLLSVPNADSFLKHQYNLLDMPPHHMTQWSVGTFRTLERILPLELIKARFEPLAEYHIPGYIDAKKNQFQRIISHLPESLNLFLLNNYESLLKIGLNRYTRGQSLYVSFRKR